MDLITKTIRLKDYKPDLAKTISEQYNIKEEDISFVRKGYTLESADLKFDEGERSSVDYITTKSVDRDGEIVDPDGIILTDYEKNKVVLYCHKYYDELPVGKCAWIKRDSKGLIAKTIYAKHQKADDIYQYRKDGFPMAKSIGFVPLESEELDPKKNAGARRIYKKSLLLEYSDVPVPSNPDAIEIAISKGILPKEEAIELGYIEIEEKTIDITITQESPKEEAETKTMEEKSIEKTVDAQGNMSVFDIIKCISMTARMQMKEMINMMNPDKMRPADPNGYDYEYCYVEDLFPTDYPNGTVILECYSRGCEEYFQYNYSIDNGVCTLLNPKMMEETYVVKPEMKALREELIKNWFPGQVLKPEMTEDNIRIPVSDAGDHSDHKVRTITISKANRIKGLYCVDDKKVFELLFNKEKWTMAEAKKWMKEHDMMKSVLDELAKSISDLADITEDEIKDEIKTTETQIPGIFDEILKELQDDITNLKAGRVISGKNRKLIQNCVDTMSTSKTMLEDLLKVTDSKEVQEEITEKTVAEDMLEFEEDEFDFNEADLVEAIRNGIKDASLNNGKLLIDKVDESVRRSMGKVY